MGLSHCEEDDSDLEEESPRKELEDIQEDDNDLKESTNSKVLQSLGHYCPPDLIKPPAVNTGIKSSLNMDGEAHRVEHMLKN